LVLLGERGDLGDGESATLPRGEGGADIASSIYGEVFGFTTVEERFRRLILAEQENILFAVRRLSCQSG
jgi:hypothetical protein